MAAVPVRRKTPRSPTEAVTLSDHDKHVTESAATAVPRGGAKPIRVQPRIQLLKSATLHPGAIEPTASEGPSDEPRRVTSFTIREGFPPDSWSIVEVKLFMPTKSSEPDCVQATESLGGPQES
ncbi:hypothetical protein FOZ62_024312, partial [Perkinsus olseni]